MAEARTSAWEFVERGEGGGYHCRLCDWVPEPDCKEDTAYRHDLKHRKENKMVVREYKRKRTEEERRARDAARQRRCYANKKMRHERAARGQDLPVTVAEHDANDEYWPDQWYEPDYQSLITSGVVRYGSETLLTEQQAEEIIGFYRRERPPTTEVRDLTGNGRSYWGGERLKEFVGKYGILPPGHNTPFMSYVRERLRCKTGEARLVGVQLMKADPRALEHPLHMDDQPDPVAGVYQRSMFLNKVVNVFIPLMDHDQPFGNLVLYTRGLIQHVIHPAGKGRGTAWTPATLTV